MNSSAIPFELAESELFGYEKGSFTGAQSAGKPGKFELAHNGTFFLDEISSLPLSIQAKLLRVFSGERSRKIGGYKGSESKLSTGGGNKCRFKKIG